MQANGWMARYNVLHMEQLEVDDMDDDFLTFLMVLMVGVILILAIGVIGASIGEKSVAEQWCMSLGHDTGSWVDDALRCVTYTMGE